MIHPMRTILPTLLLATSASAAGAQQATNDSRPASAPVAEAIAAPAPAPAADATAQSGPTIDRATAGVRVARHADAPAAANPLPRREPNNQNKAMMIVGGAGLLAGAIIGKDAGTIVMLGGAGLGLWGLWQYLQ